MADIDSFAKLAEGQMCQAAQSLFDVSTAGGLGSMESLIAIINACTRAQAMLCFALNIDPSEFDGDLEEAVNFLHAADEARRAERRQ